jgi:hypothetical protein
VAYAVASCAQGAVADDVSGPQDSSGPPRDGGDATAQPDSPQLGDAADGAGDDASLDGDDASDATNGSDAGNGSDASDGGCSTWDAGLGGIGIPSGTTATASGSYSSNTPDKAIDMDLSTYWNSGGYSGWIQLTFPSPQTIDGVRIAAVASPPTNETYQVYGITNNNPTLIGSATLSVPGSISVLPPISLTQGAYDGIKLVVGGNASWVAVAEVSLLTTGCP